jgi:hypothetical protein
MCHRYIRYILFKHNRRGGICSVERALQAKPDRFSLHVPDSGGFIRDVYVDFLAHEEERLDQAGTLESKKDIASASSSRKFGQARWICLQSFAG